MKIENVYFDEIVSDRWKVRVYVIGGDIERRAVPVIGKVGDEPVESFMSLPGGGLVGFLKEPPAAGSILFIGYADQPLLETTFEFQLLTS